MADADKDHLEPLLQQIKRLGRHAREELDWGRKHLSEDDFKTYHARIVAAFKKQVENLRSV